LRQLFFATLALTLGGACAAPMAGHSCHESERPVCADAKSALVCKDSFWTTKLCVGSCQTQPSGVVCPDPVPGGPTTGPCQGGTYACSNASTALECINGVYVDLPCRGTGGCSTANGTIHCDMNGNLEGDRCASSAVGAGLCASGGRELLECRTVSGTNTLVTTATCRSCSTANGQVTCS
jgi:hypothetical protein